MALEIERKWVVPVFPFKKNVTYRKQDIAQFYHKGARYRSVKEAGCEEIFIKTVKTGAGLIREEIETFISRDEAWEIHRMAGYPECIVKQRWFIPTGYSHHIIELDILKTGEIYAEIEFKSEYDALNFTAIPTWFGPEVTEDIFHTNYEIYKRLNGVF
ncbi:hypothetical protein PHG31p99 [Aeromonas phage 31]|uniref:Uncharacterized protein PHG31ORF101c n=1 Tax=Aeromonas phage 31 TaxID=321023 RepID=Q56ER2_9CAUD|nr:hypothetical protein PHG31p99 [Aeromonas phage 31]AAX63588.1 hypothetical protein PHG31p99 [Aeromonas phage 31]